MKRLLIAVLIAAAGLSAAAQDYEIVLINSEDMDFHYTLDPPELAGFDPGSSVFPAVVHDFFTRPGEGPTSFELLPAGTSRRLQGLAEGTYLLVGFFAEPGREDFPVRVLRLQAGWGLQERHYRLHSLSALVHVRPGRGRLRDYAVVPAAQEPAARKPAVQEPAAQKPAAEPEAAVGPAAEPDWESVPALLSFPADYRPESFTRERLERDFEVLPIRESRRWGSGGTAVHEVKMLRDERSTYLYVSTHDAISERLSIFLYFHARGSDASDNRLTVELTPQTARGPGLVVLWIRDQAPAVIGHLSSGSYSLEAEVANEDLLPHLESLPGPPYFDLTSCYFDRHELEYEEFYLGSFAFTEIPKADSLL